MLTHETSMEVPILNSLYLNNDEFLYRKEKFNFSILNGINFINPDVNKFICLKILKNIKLKNTYFEIILVSLNDYLVKMYLNDQISFIFLQKKLINLIKHPYFKKYYRLYPNNIKDIENMVEKVNIFLDKMYLKQN